MATYLYCVLAPPKPDAVPHGLNGVGNAPVRSLVSDDMGPIEAWVATVEEARLHASGQALAAQALLHNQVVSVALRTGRTPVPARYGSRFVDDCACVADLSRRSSELRALLARVADAIEMSVLVVPEHHRQPSVPLPSSKEPNAGRRYLETVRRRNRDDEEHRRAAEAEASRIMSAVSEAVREEVRSLAPSGVLSISYLVGVEGLDRFREALAAIAPSRGFRFVVGLPRAPYSFTTPHRASNGHDSGSPSRNE